MQVLPVLEAFDPSIYRKFPCCQLEHLSHANSSHLQDFMNFFLTASIEQHNFMISGQNV